jgi:hypothetical protein
MVTVSLVFLSTRVIPLQTQMQAMTLAYWYVLCGVAWNAEFSFCPLAKVNYGTRYPVPSVGVRTSDRSPNTNERHDVRWRVAVLRCHRTPLSSRGPAPSRLWHSTSSVHGQLAVRQWDMNACLSDILYSAHYISATARP